MAVELDFYLQPDSPFLPEIDFRSLNSIIRDVFLEQGYYVGEAIAKILGLYGPTRALGTLSRESSTGITPEDFLEYKRGFDRPLLLLQIAYAGVVEQPGAAEKLISWHPEAAEGDFLSENISAAVDFLNADLSGVKLINQIVRKELSSATDLYYRIGLEAVKRTFVIYSEILNTIIPLLKNESKEVKPLLQRLIEYEKAVPTSPRPMSRKKRQLEVAFARFAENPSCKTVLLIFLRRPDLIPGFVSQIVRLSYYGYKNPDNALREMSKVKGVMAKAKEEATRGEWQPGELIARLEPEFTSLEEIGARASSPTLYPSEKFVEDLQRIRQLKERAATEAEAAKKLLEEWKQLTQQPGLEECSALWTTIHIALGDFAEQQFVLTGESRYIKTAKQAYSTPLRTSILWKADLGTRCICAARLGELYCDHGSHLGMSALDVARAIHDAYLDALKSNERLYRRSPFRKSKESLQARIRLAVARTIESCVYLSERDETESANWRRRAFVIAENGKSRMLREEMALAERVPPIKIPLALQDAEKQCLARLREIYATDMGVNEQELLPEPSVQSELLEESNELRLKLESIWVQMEDFEDAGRAYVTARRDEGIDRWDVFQTVTERLGKKVALVSISRLPDVVFLSVLRAGWEAPEVRIVPLKRGQFRDVYLRSYYREMLARPLGVEKDVYTWQRLGEVVLKPLEPLLTNVELVYFFPHGSFHRLPLHALTINGKPFIERWAVAYAPSVSVLETTLSQPRSEGSVLVMGYAPPDDPRKNLSALILQEASEVANHFRVPPRLAEAANASMLKGHGSLARLIHLSCHGRFEPTDPLYSGVDLADGRFSARDWLNLKLSADLVTLSACETGMGDVRPGDDLIGLMRVILFSGASSLLMTLWAVDAQTTLEWMMKFYEGVWRERKVHGVDKAVAFRKATLELKERWPDPYYWAPFILVGNVQ